MLEAFCPKCFTRSVIKNGVKGRKLIFYDKKKRLKLKFKLINVKNVIKSSVQIFKRLLRTIVISHMILRVNVLN